MYLQDLNPDPILARHAAFWHREIIDRVCIAVTAPGKGPYVPVPGARDDAQLLTDPQYAIDASLARLQNQYLAGDALPITYAPGNLLYPAMGGAGSMGSATVWVDPTIHDWQEWADYRCDITNPWAQSFLRVNKALAEASAQRYLVATQGFFGATDAMALIRGYEDFLLEFAIEEAGETLRGAQQRAIDAHLAIIKQAWDDVRPYQRGTVTCPGIWAPGDINYWSADFSCLIGPRDFETWVIPEFEQQIALCEYSFYHLDGPDAVRHLPRIAALPGLHGIQFTPGIAIDDNPRHWLPVVQKIQSLGMATYVNIAPQYLELIMRELDPHGLFIFTWAPDPESADALVRQAAEWG